MEYFPLLSSCTLESLPGLGAIAAARRCAPIRAISLPSAAHDGCFGFCERLPAGDRAAASCAATFLVPAELEEPMARRFPAAALIVADDPRSLFIDALEHLQRSGLVGLSSLLPSDPSISTGASIGTGAIVEPGVQIDEGAVIGAGAVIRRGTWIRAGAVVGENTVIGCVGINAHRGSDGKLRRFPHVAGVVVDEGASIGASCVVVRGILSSTRVGQGAIIGNLCNIGHGVETGSNVWISAGTLVGGHTTIGHAATIAMGCTIRDNVSIGETASVGMGSVVTKNVRAGASIFGNPAKTVATIAAGPRR
jgi:UDP-3-O-[3-hydroxymyristoyl] glucosamine N-acyltransferase